MADDIAQDHSRHGLARLLASPRHRLIAGGLAAVLVIATGTGVAFATTRGEGGRYRTALATLGDVSETLALTGQVSSADSAAAAFQVSGTVGSVLVALGDKVTAGQKLATLDGTSLHDAVTTAQNALATAQQQLEDDLDAQNTGTTSPSASDSAATATPSATGPSTSRPAASSAPSARGALTAAQKMVEAAQKTLLAQYAVSSQAQSASGQAAAAAQQVCAPFLEAKISTAGTPTASASPSPTPDGTAAPEGTTTSGSSSSDMLAATPSLLTDCQSSITGTLAAQKATAAAQERLQSDATALDDAVAALQKATLASDARTTTTPTPSASQGSSPRTSSSTGGRTVTAEQILADRARIDSDQAAVAVAQQNLGFTTLTSPIAGTVVDVALTAGQAVSASSASATITVQGDGGYIVTSTVPLAKIAKVHNGQKTQIVLPAFGKTYAGTIASVGVANVSQTSTPSYSVTVAVDAGGDALRIGATARATVTVATAQNVLTVPTSAVTFSGSDASVRVLRDGSAIRTAVEVGAVGAERIEVAKGLTAGEPVVLADLDEQIATGSSNGLTGLNGTRRFRSFSGTGLIGSGLTGTGLTGTGFARTGAGTGTARTGG